MDFVTVRYIECMNGISPLKMAIIMPMPCWPFGANGFSKWANQKNLLLLEIPGMACSRLYVRRHPFGEHRNQKVSSQGGIYVLKDVNGFAVRRIQAEIGSKNLKLICDNKIYEPTITAAETINIYGKAVWVGGRIDV